jgi:hypothetical protein
LIDNQSRLVYPEWQQMMPTRTETKPSRRGEGKRMKLPFAKKRPEVKPRTPQEEAAYHRGMARLCVERGYENLAVSHVIASLEAEGM